MDEVIPSCPICNKSDQVIRIIYGYPTDEALRLAGEEKVFLGGDNIRVDDDWFHKFEEAVEKGTSFDLDYGLKKWYCKKDHLKF